MSALVLALAIVTAILAGIDLIRTRGTALTSWAVEALALALLLPQVVG